MQNIVQTMHLTMSIAHPYLASHSAVVCYVHISNLGVWEILCLANEKYSVWQWRNTQGLSLHNPAAEAHVTWRQTGRHWGGSLGRDVPGHRVLWQWYFLTIEEVIHLWTLITVQMEIFAKNRSFDVNFARLPPIRNSCRICIFKMIDKTDTKKLDTLWIWV